MSNIEEIANKLDPTEARLACAKILAALGGSLDWGSDHLEWVADAIEPVTAGTGLPTFTDQDDAAVDFWTTYF